MPQRITLYNEADSQKASDTSNTATKMTSEYAPGVSMVGRTKKTPALCPTDDDAIVPSKPRTKLDKKSPEYLLKSGVAGGLAGCAVCFWTVGQDLLS
jgi:solute carrier family 25 protein 16